MVEKGQKQANAKVGNTVVARPSAVTCTT